MSSVRRVDAVTIATLVVAGATFLLAWATFRLGSRATEETRAQWRPVLLVRPRRASDDVKMRVGNERLSVEIANVGRGPALDVTARTLVGKEWSFVRRVSAMAPEEVELFELPLSSRSDTTIGLRLDYADISHAGHGTVVLIDVSEPAEPRLVTQDFEMHPPITFWWAMIVPRRFRRHLHPLTRWALRRRGYELP